MHCKRKKLNLLLVSLVVGIHILILIVVYLWYNLNWHKPRHRPSGIKTQLLILSPQQMVSREISVDRPNSVLNTPNPEILDRPHASPKSTKPVVPITQESVKKIENNIEFLANPTKKSSSQIAKPSKTEKDKSHLRTPEEIRQSKLSKNVPSKSSEVRSSDVNTEKFNAKQFAKSLHGKLINTRHVDNNSVNNGLNTTNLARGNENGINAGNAIDWNDDYYQLILSSIDQKWDQPTITEVSHADLFVEIKIEINQSGKLIGRSIVRKSGDIAMDNSVSRLLQNLSDFPPLPSKYQQKSISLSITLRLTD